MNDTDTQKLKAAMEKYEAACPYCIGTPEGSQLRRLLEAGAEFHEHLPALLREREQMQARIETLTRELSEANTRLYAALAMLPEGTTCGDVQRATARLERMEKALRELIEYGELWPSRTKTGGANCDKELHEIEHGLVWGFANKLKIARAALAKGEDARAE